MLAIVGTIPDTGFPVISGKVHLKNDRITIKDQSAPINRGTPALLAAAIKCGEVLGLESPIGFLVGDIGLGDGSRLLYDYLSKKLKDFNLQVLCFHYLQPDVDWQFKVLDAIEKMKRRPFLIADAGYMYAAKMSGLSQEYDLFTPDVGELAFLADEEAPHPFYTRGFILHEAQKVLELIKRAYEHQNAAVHLLIKGKKDYIVKDGITFNTVSNPSIENMEAIGGTGDTLTGIVSALISSGMGPKQASVIAAKTNRLAGYYTQPNPASQIIDIISNIPQALTEVLKSM